MVCHCFPIINNISSLIFNFVLNTAIPINGFVRKFVFRQSCGILHHEKHKHLTFIPKTTVSGTTNNKRPYVLKPPPPWDIYYASDVRKYIIQTQTHSRCADGRDLSGQYRMLSGARSAIDVKNADFSHLTAR